MSSKTGRRLVFAMSIVALVGVGATGNAGAVVGGPAAGFVAPPGSGSTQTAATTFVVPRISCATVPSGGFQAVLAGARLSTPGGNSGGGVVLVCPGSGAVYNPFIQINGSSVGSGITVNVGDTVSVSVSEGPAGTSVTLTDGAQTQTASGPGGAPTSETIGAIAGNCNGSGACSPVPKFRPIAFSAASINGQNLHVAGARRRNLTDATAAVEVKSGPLGPAFDSFTTKWIQSCSTGPGIC
jgi:hypothetical protein